MTTLTDLVAIYRSHYYLRDLAPLLAVLATVGANRMSGDPFWLLLVAPPSAGKSELLGLLAELPETFAVATISEGGLLSASLGGEQATGGLLSEIEARCDKSGGPSYGLLVVSDLSTLLGGSSDMRDRTFGLLRVVFDRRPVVRHSGAAGGRTFEAGPKVGTIAAVTGAIDLVDLGILGDRFVYLRFPEATPEDEATTLAFASENVGRQPEIRAELVKLTTEFFASLDLPERPPLPSAADHERLSALARIGARCRSAVPRESAGSRDVLALLQPEMPTRLYQELAQLLAGLRAIGVSEPDLWRVLSSAALDGMSAARRSVLDALVAAPWENTVVPISDRVGLPRTTTLRVLEDLAALRVLDREDDPQDPRLPSHWSFTKEMRRLWEEFVAPPSPDEANSRRLVESAFPRR